MKVVDGTITWPSNSIVTKGGYIAVKKNLKVERGHIHISALFKCTA